MGATKQLHHQCDAAAKDVRPAILHHECVVQPTKEHAQPVTIDDGLPVAGAYAGDCESKTPAFMDSVSPKLKGMGRWLAQSLSTLFDPYTMHWKGQVWTMLPISTAASHLGRGKWDPHWSRFADRVGEITALHSQNAKEGRKQGGCLFFRGSM